MFFKSPSFYNDGEEVAMRPVQHRFQMRKPMIKRVFSNAKVKPVTGVAYISKYFTLMTHLRKRLTTGFLANNKHVIRH